MGVHCTYIGNPMVIAYYSFSPKIMQKTYYLFIFCNCKMIVIFKFLVIHIFSMKCTKNRPTGHFLPEIKIYLLFIYLLSVKFSCFTRFYSKYIFF